MLCVRKKEGERKGRGEIYFKTQAGSNASITGDIFIR